MLLVSGHDSAAFLDSLFAFFDFVVCFQNPIFILNFLPFIDVHRHIQYKAQKQHRGDKTLSSEQLPEYGNSPVLFECLIVDVVIKY